MSKKNKYFKQQNAYFKRTGKDRLNDMNDYTVQVVSDGYILLNPAFPVEVAYSLLSVHNKRKEGMLIKGTPKDFKDNPNEVYRVVREKKTLTVKRPEKESV